MFYRSGTLNRMIDKFRVFKIISLCLIGLLSIGGHNLHAADEAEKERNLQALKDSGWDEPYRWEIEGPFGANPIPLKVGDIYTVERAGLIQYYRLAKINKDGTVMAPDYERNDNLNWESLGTSIADAPFVKVLPWNTNDRKGTIGDVYIYSNPYMKEVQYFRLKALGSDGRYWYFPTDRSNNTYWTYIGNNYTGG